MNVKTCCRLCCDESLTFDIYTSSFNDTGVYPLDEMIYLLTNVKVF